MCEDFKLKRKLKEISETIQSPLNGVCVCVCCYHDIPIYMDIPDYLYE